MSYECRQHRRRNCSDCERRSRATYGTPHDSMLWSTVPDASSSGWTSGGDSESSGGESSSSSSSSGGGCGSGSGD